VLEVKISNYYRFQKRKNYKAEDPDHDDLIGWIQDIAKFYCYTYSERRIKAVLNTLSFLTSRYKVAMLMTEVGFSFLVKKYKVTTNSDHKLPVFNNFLNSEFDVALADQTYVADITYILVPKGWLHLVVVINLYSRKVFGLIIGSRIKVQLVCDAKTMAICQRRPSAGLIVQTDQCQQVS